ncbi:MAG: hypothetical protein FWF85_04060 [Clostridiales bacterium]|jgi:hypothetical protein|nr:hypothetical protein [Clostridiales bacterium]
MRTSFYPQIRFIRSDKNLTTIKLYDRPNGIPSSKERNDLPISGERINDENTANHREG